MSALFTRRRPPRRPAAVRQVRRNPTPETSGQLAGGLRSTDSSRSQGPRTPSGRPRRSRAACAIFAPAGGRVEIVNKSLNDPTPRVLRMHALYQETCNNAKARISGPQSVDRQSGARPQATNSPNSQIRSDAQPPLSRCPAHARALGVRVSSHGDSRADTTSLIRHLVPPWRPMRRVTTPVRATAARPTPLATRRTAPRAAPHATACATPQLLGLPPMRGHIGAAFRV